MFFSAGSRNGSQVCIDIVLLDDRAFEKDEYFTVVVSSEQNVRVHNNFTVHIVDDDCKTIASSTSSSFGGTLLQSSLHLILL